MWRLTIIFIGIQYGTSGIIQGYKTAGKVVVSQPTVIEGDLITDGVTSYGGIYISILVY